MFASLFSRRWLKYISQPKKYTVQLEVQIGDSYLFKDIEVEAFCKADAKKLAYEKVKSEFKIVVHGMKSNGRAKRFEQIM